MLHHAVSASYGAKTWLDHAKPCACCLTRTRGVTPCYIASRGCVSEPYLEQCCSEKFNGATRKVSTSEISIKTRDAWIWLQLAKALGVNCTPNQSMSIAHQIFEHNGSLFLQRLFPCCLFLLKFWHTLTFCCRSVIHYLTLTQTSGMCHWLAIIRSMSWQATSIWVQAGDAFWAQEMFGKRANHPGQSYKLEVDYRVEPQEDGLTKIIIALRIPLQMTIM